MKKNYALMILFALFMGVNVSAVDLVGIYKLGGLTAETTAALGDISPDAMFRIMSGDGDADYYMTGVAGYGCKWAVAYDESAGTLTVTDPSEYGVQGMGMVLYSSDESMYYTSALSLAFTVGADDGVLTMIGDDMTIENPYIQDTLGTYTKGLTLTKQNITTPAAADLTGDYTFTGTQLDMIEGPTPVEYSMSVSQTEGNTLSINGFMGMDSISATYLPDVAMVTIKWQDIDNVTVGQILGDIYFMLSDKGAWALATPAIAEVLADEMTLAYLIDGTAVKSGSAVDLVGVYKLGGLTDETTAALGRISPDAMFRIMPGDGDADYYMTGVAGYGCKWAVAYDESAGTLTVTDASPYSAYGFGMLLYYSDLGYLCVDTQSLAFTVGADGVLTIDENIAIVEPDNDEDELEVGTYTKGLTLTKQKITTPAAADLTGDYTFTGNDMMTGSVEYSMSVSQTEGDTLSINGFMGVDNISATYLPDVAMVVIPEQEADTVTVGQMLGDIYFILSDDGSWTLTTPAIAEVSVDGEPMPLAYLIDGTAVKGGSSAVRELPTGEEAVSVYGSNGFVYVVSDAPVAVQIYNAAGVQVYGSAAVSAPISLNKGYYLVRVAGNRKAVPVIL